MTSARWERVLSVASPVVLLVLWELAADHGTIDTRFFPAPSSVLRVLLQMLAPSPPYPLGELWFHTSASLSRVAIGFVLGTVPAVGLGLWVGLQRPVHAVLQPLIDATFPIPKIAALPLLVLIFGLGEASKWAVIAIAVFYLVLINTLAGVHAIDRMYLDVGRNYHASAWLMFRDIALPGALPMIMAGLRLGMGVGLLVIVAAEQVAATSGIGYLIWTSWQVLQVEKMYVGLLMSALLGFGTAAILRQVERVLIPWRSAWPTQPG